MDTQTDKKTTIDDQDLLSFSTIADQWWDEMGPFKPLHQMNPIRLRYIKDKITDDVNDPHALKGISILDIGCGGGLLCEPLARMGATVTGLDAAPENIALAKKHAAQQHDTAFEDLRYFDMPVEDFADLITEKKETQFDVVIALEIIEHVADIDLFLTKALACLKPGGTLIVSTLNRTAKSFALGIVAAEYILNLVPKGTHDWKKFVKPSEIVRILENHKTAATDITGMTFNPLTSKFTLTDTDFGVNYFMTAIKA